MGIEGTNFLRLPSCPGWVERLSDAPPKQTSTPSAEKDAEKKRIVRRLASAVEWTFICQ